jgi:hypothetical protein
MSAENQPSDDLPIYLPFGWQSDATGDFVTYPIAQSSNIVFPISIASNSVDALNSSASVNLYQNVTTGNLNLYNDSTTGHLEIANNSGYAGGIVINSNAVAPVANTVRIGDTDRPVVMPRVKLTQIDPIGAAGVFVNSDMTIANGSELFVNEIKPNTSTTVSLPNGATTTAPANGDTSSRIVTSQWVFNQGFLSSAVLAGYAKYASATAFSVLQTFDAGIKSNSIVTTGGNLELPATILSPAPVAGDNTTRVPTTAWVNSAITSALNATTLFAKYASTTAFTVQQTFSSGIKTDSITTSSGGMVLSLPATSVTAPVSGDTSTRVPSTQWVADEGYGKKTGTNTWSNTNTFTGTLKTDSIALDAGSTLSLPASTTTAPDTGDTGSNRVVTSQWVRDQGFTSASGYVTYNGLGPFVAVQSFSVGIELETIKTPFSSGHLYICSNQTAGGTITLGSTDTVITAAGTFKTNAISLVSGTELTLPNIKTNAISIVSGTELTLPVATTTTPPVPDNTTKVPTTGWVTTTITNAINAISGFATYAGTTAFTALQTFNGGVTINSAATPLTITASGTAETYNAGGASAPTVRRFIGSTTGASAMSTTFYRRNIVGNGVANPYKIFTTSSVVTSQYMELFINGVFTRASGGNNVFSTKATFVITNSSGAINISNLAYPLQYSSVTLPIGISVSLFSATELRLFIDTTGGGGAVRQDYYATLVAYPSMGVSSATSNFTITVQAF